MNESQSEDSVQDQPDAYDYFKSKGFGNQPQQTKQADKGKQGQKYGQEIHVNTQDKVQSNYEDFEDEYSLPGNNSDQDDFEISNSGSKYPMSTTKKELFPVTTVKHSIQKENVTKVDTKPKGAQQLTKEPEKQKVDAYKYYQQKFGKVEQEESEEMSVSDEMEIQQTGNKIGADKFDDDDYDDSNNFDVSKSVSNKGLQSKQVPIKHDLKEDDLQQQKSLKANQQPTKQETINIKKAPQQLEPKVEPYKYFQEKLGKKVSNTESDEDLEISNDIKHVGQDDFDSDSNHDEPKNPFAPDNDFDNYSQSGEASEDKLKFSVKMEKSNQQNPTKSKPLTDPTQENLRLQYEKQLQDAQKKEQSNSFKENPFKDKALVQSDKKQTPARQQTYQSQQMEIKMKSDFKQQSEIDFAESIEEEDLGEKDDFYGDSNNMLSNSHQNNKGVKDSSTVNMGSVIPNPKMLQQTQFKSTKGAQDSLVNMASVVPNPKMQSTKQQTSSQYQQKTVNRQIQEDDDFNELEMGESIQEEGEEFEESKKVHFKVQKVNDSFQRISQQIEKIEPKWSPKNSKNAGKPNIPTDRTKTQTKKQEEVKVTAAKSTSKPRPNTAHVTNPKPGQQKPKNLPALSGRTNSDLKEVMKSQERLPQAKETSQTRQRSGKKGGNMAGIEEEDKEVDAGQLKRLLEQKTKQANAPIRARPESAKPKVGFQGQANLLGGKGNVLIPQQNTNDLTTQLAKNKKFQAIKKLKEAKEKQKDVVIRNLQKTKVIQQPKATNAADERQIRGRNQQKKLQDRSFDEGLFEEEEMGEADQAFGGDEEDAQELTHLGMIQTNNQQQDDFLESDGDQFVDLEGQNDSPNDGNLSSQARQTVKDIAKEKRKKEDNKNWIGNALGSGQFQQVNEQITRDNVNIQLDQQRRQRPQPLQELHRESGFSSKPGAPMTKNGQKLIDLKNDKIAAEQAEERRLKEMESRQKFNQIVKEKKDKAVNKDVVAFMMGKNKMQKSQKKQTNAQNVNKLVSGFELFEEKAFAPTQAAPVSKGSDKVPDHAKLVVDKESQSKQVDDLKLLLKGLYFENRKIQSNITLVERRTKQKADELEKVVKDKNLVNVNGKLEVGITSSQMLNTSSISKNFRLEDIPNYEQAIKQETKNPLEPVVKKIEQRGYTLEQAFMLLDENGDEILTLQEIQCGLKAIGVILTPEEMKLLLTQIDVNHDGVLTMDEFVSTLNPRMGIEVDFRLILQGIDIDDPLVLEEKILDLRYRARRLEQDVEVLKETVSNEVGYRKLKQPLKSLDHVKMAEKIKLLEGDVMKKMGMLVQEKVAVEEKLRANMTGRDKVNFEFEATSREIEQIQRDYQNKVQLIKDELNDLNFKAQQVTLKCQDLKQKKIQKQQELSQAQIQANSMKDAESKLDKQLEEILGRAVYGKDLEMLYELDMKTLRELSSGGTNKKLTSFVEHFASLTIQRHFRGVQDRMAVKILRFKMKRLVRRLEPLVKDKITGRRIRAASVIQKSFRRFKQRREQYERLKQQSQIKKLREEEDDKFYHGEAQKKKAALVIVRRWRAYKLKQKFDMTSLVRTAKSKAFGQAKTVYMQQIKKCLICKKANAQRMCQECSEALFCKECFSIYHMRGHRKNHTYLRIVYGSEEESRNQEQHQLQSQSLKPSLKKENLEPNKTSSLSQTQKQQVSDVNIRKSVKIDNQAFLKCIRDLFLQHNVNFTQTLNLILKTPQQYMQMKQLRQMLMQNCESFGMMTREEAGRLAEVAGEELGDDSGDIDLLKIGKMVMSK